MSPRNPEDEGETEGRSYKDKTVSEVLGEIIWLMTQSKDHHSVRMDEIELRVMRPILLRQFKIFYKDNIPSVAVLYALVSKEAYKREPLDPLAMSLEQWRTGTEKSITTIIAPFGVPDEVRFEFGAGL